MYEASEFGFSVTGLAAGRISDIDGQPLNTGDCCRFSNGTEIAHLTSYSSHRNDRYLSTGSAVQ